MWNIQARVNPSLTQHREETSSIRALQRILNQVKVDLMCLLWVVVLNEHLRRRRLTNIEMQAMDNAKDTASKYASK